MPLHFYGELVKTPEGRMILEAKGHFREFVDFIRTHGMEDEDIEVIDKLKSILWAVVSLCFYGQRGPAHISTGSCRIE